MRKRVIIIGPLVDYGGREVETNIIAKSLEDSYDLTIMSTVHATSKSMANDGLKNTLFTTLDREFVKSNFLIYFFSCLFYLKKGLKGNVYLYSDNRLTRFFFKYSKVRLQFLLKYVEKFDLVIFEMEFRNSFYQEVIDHCNKNNKPCFFRTTRTIFDVSDELADTLKKVSLFIHHSNDNANNLKKYVAHDYSIIDQCAINEEKLLNIKTDKHSRLRYGFLGRLSHSKQIMPLTHFFLNKDYEFYIGGDGELKEELLSLIDTSQNCRYLGFFESERMHEFFDKIDVLIISSLEESGPLVGVEALAAGKIIISTKVGAMPERLEKTNNSFWFDRDNVNSIENVINDLESLPAEKLEAISIENRQFYLENMSLDVIKNKYLESVNLYLNKSNDNLSSNQPQP